MTVLEERVHHLESKVAALTDALRVLTKALEGGPLAEPGEQRVPEAARTARELLLSAHLAGGSGPGGPSQGGPSQGGSGSGGAAPAAQGKTGTKKPSEQG